MALSLINCRLTTACCSRYNPERKKSIRVESESLHSRGPFWARKRRANDTNGEERRRRWMLDGAEGGGEGQRKRWPPTIRSALARSFTYSLSSLVSILSPLCVLLIYRAAGKCLRHSPSIVQPISLLFFLLLHLRVSSRHFLFPSPVRSSCERFAPFSAALYRGSHTPFLIVPNILTDSDHKESPRG